ncbi:endonuclease [Cupriavidus necator]|uniref:Endonuclease n=1 Tax=Cupriavidus necator TaxID=106590 RepID=A0A367PPC8_CUPNE|nr:endonuclease [Cupriavidus necator]QQX86304.1 endonuclease [Cupriavidus necator]RCJ09668.1 endonuclease [Cupriavidus necator]
MKHIRPCRLLAAVALAAAAISAMAQAPGTPRGTYDPYSQGARSTDKFDPYSQGANAPTRTDLAPAPEAQPSTMPAQPGVPDTTMQRAPDPYMGGPRWESPDLGRRVGKPNPFLDGS